MVEFPYQTLTASRNLRCCQGFYDAGYGRYAGANVSLATKTGGNAFHGTVFEFIRNEALNANDFFLNRAGQPRPVLRENQFGFSIGGPVQKEKLLFFGSYQGTRQVNGVASDGLEVSLTKRLNHGLQFLASYTFSKTLDTDGADINSTSSGNALTLGDQNSARQRWGRASFDRTHRFVLSGIWALPSPHGGSQRAVLGRWDLASIVTVQSGNALTIANTSPSNVFGISEDRAELAPNCNKSQVITGGSMRGKLNSYFNTSCFTTPPVIGQDGIGTGFENGGTGIVDGPPQTNVDLALSKTVASNWLSADSSLQFRTELYNALNHPQFANSDNNFASPAFGVISSTSVNPRVIQFALKLNF